MVAPAWRREPAAQVVARALNKPYQDPRECRCLQFFLEVTAAQFATFFRDDISISTVLQIAQSEPSIRHAMVALSFHHESYARRGLDVADANFAAQQYSFAIRELTSTKEQLPTYVHLLSCLLFIWAEVSAGMLGHATVLDLPSAPYLLDMLRPFKGITSLLSISSGMGGT